MVSQPRFVILEDHPLVREALAERLVRHLGDVDFVYTGDSVSAALSAIEVRGVDCVVMDLDLNDSVSPIVNVVSLAETGAG